MGRITKDRIIRALGNLTDDELREVISAAKGLTAVDSSTAHDEYRQGFEDGQTVNIKQITEFVAPIVQQTMELNSVAGVIKGVAIAGTGEHQRLSIHHLSGELMNHAKLIQQLDQRARAHGIDVPEKNLDGVKRLMAAADHLVATGDGFPLAQAAIEQNTLVNDLLQLRVELLPGRQDDPVTSYLYIRSSEIKTETGLSWRRVASQLLNQLQQSKTLTIIEREALELLSNHEKAGDYLRKLASKKIKKASQKDVRRFPAGKS